ncbi:MAG TPA: FkbM family methyltransferase [Stellaceae bacterium]|nr:FkbM family methyltransferase [Stellaceae bacterium]
MRFALLYNPRLLCERLAIESTRRRRLARLRGTAADRLSPGHIDSLELLEMLRGEGIDVIYDIGANIGTWTLLAKALYPDAQIHAFEPLPRHRDDFRANLARFADVRLHGVALGNRDQEDRQLHVMDFSDASSLLALAEPGRSHWGIGEIAQVPVKLCRLDDYRQRFDLPKPDLIKLDVQGYELEVLKGAKASLTSVKALIVEVSFAEFYEGQCLFEELVGFVAEQGFRLKAIGVNTPLGRPLAQTDGLFVRTT